MAEEEAVVDLDRPERRCSHRDEHSHQSGAPGICTNRAQSSSASLVGRTPVRCCLIRANTTIQLGMVADGMTEKDILQTYPDLERDDIAEALRYAADAVRERELPLTHP